jgi:NAD(P)H dehydrogenase (quinone)
MNRNQSPRLVAMFKKRVFLFFFVFLSAQSATAQVQVLVAYHSETGNTERMAEAVAEGARNVDGAVVYLKSVVDVDMDLLLSSDAIIVGSPVYNANVTPQVSEFIASWPFDGAPLRNKVGAAFVTAGGISAGEEIVQMNILKSMLIFGMVIVGGDDWTQPFGASAVTGEPPFETESPDQIRMEFLQKGKELGERVAQTAIRLAE